MISEKDIEAWREDEKQTDFLDTRVKAVNHLGWAVEYLDLGKGWRQVSKTAESYKQAYNFMTLYVGLWPDAEFRVYEVLKGKNEDNKRSG